MRCCFWSTKKQTTSEEASSANHLNIAPPMTGRQFREHVRKQLAARNFTKVALEEAAYLYVNLVRPSWSDGIYFRHFFDKCYKSGVRV